MKTFFTFLILFIATTSIKATVFTSNVATGTWSVSSTWLITGPVDADGIPDFTDTVIILNGHTVKFTKANNDCKMLTIDNGGVLNANNKNLRIKGNFTNFGTIINNIQVYAQATMTLSCASSFTNTGNIFVQIGTLTIAAGTTISRQGAIIIQNSASKVINRGTVTLFNTGTYLGNVRFYSNNTSWTNASGSSLSMNGNLQAGTTTHTFDCSAASNTVTYAGSCNVIDNTTFNTLRLTSNTTKNLSSSLVVTGDFFMSGGGNVLNTNGNNMTVGGNFGANCIINFTPGDKVILNGSGTQTISGAPNTQFYDLEVNNTGGGIVFTSTKTITNDLIMIKGNCNSGTNRLVLASDASNTARIAEITNPLDISFSGSMVIQKFIDNMPYNYYDLSSPVQSTTVNDWDNEIFISGIGAYDNIGGPAGVDGDVFNGVQSMNTYDETSNTFSGVTGSSTTLDVGKGYQLILADNSTSWFAKTLDTRGVPNYGDVAINGLTYTSGSGEGWHLVGNPYACHIDYSLVSKTRMTPNIYYTAGGNYFAWPNGTSIPPHQGFYVETNTSSLAHSITFTEACKEVNHTTEFYRTKSNYDIKLMISSSSSPYHHENSINFDNNASVKYEEDFDAKYRKFPVAIAPAIYMIDAQSKQNMIKNVIDSKQEEITIPIGIFTPKVGTYYIDASILNKDSYNFVWLENTKTGASYDLNNAIVVEGTDLGTNTDFVLHLSKSKKSSSVSETILEADLLIFSTENAINLKSSTSGHYLKELTVYDMTGKLMLSQYDISVTPENITKIDISELANGIYIVNAIDELGRATSKKLVK